MTDFDASGWLPFQLDPILQRVLWVHLDAGQRRAAAFLDERALPAAPRASWAPLSTLAQEGRAADAHAIFHIGHCGSTLLSRLLESWSGVAGLREPLPLRTLAAAWAQRDRPDARWSVEQLEWLLHSLWARWSSSPDATRSVVKATSGCNALVEPLLRLAQAPKVVLLDMPLRPYLATLWKAPTSVHDAAAAAGERLIDLQTHGFLDGRRLHEFSLPEQCALGWVAEQLRFDRIARAHPARVLRVDFESLLGEPEATLSQVAAHLGLDPSMVATALASPAWGRYAKAEQHGYSPADRQHDLRLSEQRNAGLIEEGLAWARAFLADAPGAEGIVERLRD